MASPFSFSGGGGIAAVTSVAGRTGDVVLTSADLADIIDVIGAPMPEDFGAVGDGTTDDQTALEDWLNAIMASDTRCGRASAKVYAHSAALPTINVSGVRIICPGPVTDHDVGSRDGGVMVLKAITNTGFTQLTVDPGSGASNQALDSVVLSGITCDCNGKADTGIVIRSVRNVKLRTACLEAVSCGLIFEPTATLGEAADVLRADVRHFFRQVNNDAPAARIKGNSAHNSPFNEMLFDGLQNNTTAVIVENADNSEITVRAIRAAGGTATYSVELLGGASSSERARDMILNLSSTVKARVYGTETYASPATNIIINRDTSNGTPATQVGTGCSVAELTYTSFKQVADTTAYGATIIAAADAAAARTVLGAGTYSLANNTIVAARLAAAASSILFGRTTAGAGAGEEIAISANVLTMLQSANNAAIRSNIGAVNIAGDTITGTVNITASPIALNLGNAVSFSQSNLLNLQNANGTATVFTVVGDGGNAQMTVRRFDATANGAVLNLGKGRGSAGSPAGANASDTLASLIFQGYDSGATLRSTGSIRAVAVSALTSTNGETRIVFNTAPSTSVTEAENARLDQATGFSMYGANPVIDANRVFRNRIYTVATLPTGVDGMRTYVSDALAPTALASVTGGGAVHVPVFYDGSAWKVG